MSETFQISMRQEMCQERRKSFSPAGRPARVGFGHHGHGSRGSNLADARLVGISPKVRVTDAGPQGDPGLRPPDHRTWLAAYVWIAIDPVVSVAASCRQGTTDMLSRRSVVSLAQHAPTFLLHNDFAGPSIFRYSERRKTTSAYGQ
jgi:hypothetical protein